ncbi:MAG: DinB family protein [Bryobacterales bacterium]|jgi:hypothetical protein|nr:DinB family protein [Bryobacterales bacterium]
MPLSGALATHLTEPALRDLVSQLEQVTADAVRLTTGLSAEQFNWQPRPDSWSIAQCLAHLNATGAWYLPYLEAAAQQGRDRDLRGRGPFRHSAFWNWVLGLTEPPPKMRLPAPGRLVPPSNLDLDQTLTEFFTVQRRFLACFEVADGLDLRRIKVRTPMTGWIRTTLLGGFAVMMAHERRHIWQAWQRRHDARYPSA